MKLSLAVTIISAQAARLARDVEEKGIEEEKRYFQLTDMMEHYNPEFDERKYWAYGCNCLILGDRPMSDPGHGPPVDELDSVCKEYKDCVKCAQMKFGEMCIGEFVKYKYSKKNGEITCKNDADTCGRALCECDHLLARKHVAKKDVFDSQYHMFWSTNDGGEMWNPKEDPEYFCPRNGGGPYTPECCTNQAGTTPFILFNAEVKECCNDGTVKLEGQC